MLSFSRRLFSNLNQEQGFQKLKEMIPKNTAPKRYVKSGNEIFNPIVFNRINEHYVIKGKEKLVGLWLASVSTAIFGMVVLGGYTRLTKSGLSMVRWEPHRIMPPLSQGEWEKEFEEYKKSPEWIEVNSKKGMELSGFKYIFFWEWAHRVLGRSIGFIFFVPMTYFFARGYLQNRLKLTLLSLFGLGGVQGAIGWWMVSSGLDKKDLEKKVDKTPRVSPYRLATHAGFAYALYSVCLWQTFNLLRRPQEAVITNFEQLRCNNMFKKTMTRATKIFLPLVLVTGFFTAGTNAGISCNTFPFVGSNWFYNSNHFFNNEQYPFWKNFTENKLICQVNHRTLATLMTLFLTQQSYKLLMLGKLSMAAKRSIVFLIFTLWMQLGIGINVIWLHVPIWLASYHQIGAMTALSAVLFAMHNCRKIDPRHMKNMLGKLRITDKKEYANMMRFYSKQMNLTTKDVEAHVKEIEQYRIQK